MGALKIVFYKILKYLVEGSFLRHIREELDEILGRIGRFILLLVTPVNPKKVFFHTQEDRYACNQKYICEEFRRRNLEDVELVWRCSGGNNGGIPADVKTVTGGTFEYFRELFSSKYIFANSVLYCKKGFTLKPNQVLFQTWHGSLGIKRFGKKDYKGGWHWVRAAIRTGKLTDYCITNSSFVSSSLGATYWPKTPMLEYGHPRNDLFFDTNKEIREGLRERLCKEWGVSPDTKFVMYGPTFRDNKNFDCYDIDFKRLLKSLKEKFGGEWCVLMRYHPSLLKVYKARGILESTDYPMINVTSHIDMQELIAVADVAITDYSSWIYDFMLRRLPGFIFATDISLYNNERGFCYPLETTPFPISTNNDELNESVINFDNQDYLNKLEAFLVDKGCIEDGHASERAVDKVLELMAKEK